MGNLATQAIVLRRADWRDHDRVLTLLSPTCGRIEAVSRGCRRLNSPLASASEAFCCGEYVFYRGKEHATLTSCEITEAYYPLRQDMDKLTLGVYFLNMAEACAQENEDCRALYALLLRSLHYLTYGTQVNPKALCSAYLTCLVQLMGYKPRLRYCSRCDREILAQEPMAFDPAGGGICCARCAGFNAMSFSHPERVWMSHIFRTGIDGFADLPPENAPYHQLRRFAEAHLEVNVRSEGLLPD